MELIETEEFNFDEAADLCGLSGLQRTFAKAILRGANRKQAAKAAGYSGTDEQLRGVGYKAYNSPKVQSFLALAGQEGYGVPDDPGDAKELKRILWKHARGDDKNHAIRASEVLYRIEKEEAFAREQNSNLVDHAATLKQLAEHNPELAASLAIQYGISWRPEGWENIPRCPSCGQLNIMKKVTTEAADIARSQTNGVPA